MGESIQPIADILILHLFHLNVDNILSFHFHLNSLMYPLEICQKYMEHSQMERNYYLCQNILHSRFQISNVNSEFD